MRAQGSMYDDPSAAAAEMRSGGDDQHADRSDPAQPAVHGRDRELVNLLNELEEHAAEEAGYGHGV